uniref:Uncharacterized protein n=1 Tax=Chromera velia CCMP2878 TaxID=1169474 RepID=A0A0G4GT54_9ALVE|eukprot:Cvel_5163.t1-p1 / transcript=Cvel_5163.t1 / gene=Cvel_5163 / organism=Chromera_velia_CCMP2878 / gene_product=hypothetical protein / transcript_product=hypothetical protein / location=Cvel_scaffold237:11650-17861(+) / protein_length=553 / sequence_SO=supercontig / SO=protein_coding / is_pseudo=false
MFVPSRNLEESQEGQCDVGPQPTEDQAVSNLALFILLLAFSLLEIGWAVRFHHKGVAKIGSVTIQSLRKARGYSSEVVGSKSFPPSRAINVVLALVLAAGNLVKSGIYLDKHLGNDVGLDLTAFLYWQYLAAAPLSVYDFAEAIDLGGTSYYAAAFLFVIFFFSLTEYLRHVAHWLSFALAIALMAGVSQVTTTEAIVKGKKLYKYHVTRIMTRNLAILLGFYYFLRTDTDPSRGVLDPSAVVPILLGFEFFALLLVGEATLRHRAFCEDFHLLEILRALRWVKIDNKTGREVGEQTREGPALPPAVLLITIPALLEYSLDHTPTDKVESLKKAEDFERRKTLMNIAQVGMEHLPSGRLAQKILETRAQAILQQQHRDHHGGGHLVSMNANIHHKRRSKRSSILHAGDDENDDDDDLSIAAISLPEDPGVGATWSPAPLTPRKEHMTPHNWTPQTHSRAIDTQPQAGAGKRRVSLASLLMMEVADAVDGDGGTHRDHPGGALGVGVGAEGEGGTRRGSLERNESPGSHNQPPSSIAEAENARRRRRSLVQGIT